MTGKVYLGDGAYAEFDEFGDLVLTTEDGIRTTNRVVLEPGVLVTLLRELLQRNVVQDVVRRLLRDKEPVS